MKKLLMRAPAGISLAAFGALGSQAADTRVCTPENVDTWHQAEQLTLQRQIESTPQSSAPDGLSDA
jgi:hypothetical protein